MTLKKQINNWFIHFKKYFFRYKQGYYEISYIANSPEATVESYRKMPFFKHNKKHQTFKMTNVFLKVIFRYFKIEEGLWLSISDISLFKNVKINLLYDEFINDRYHTLSLNFVNNNSIKISNLVNNSWVLSNMSWILIKPRENAYHINFKDSNAKYIVFYFTEEWLKNQLRQGGLFYKKGIEEFILSSEKFALFSDDNSQLFSWHEELNNFFEEEIDTKNSKQHKKFLDQSKMILSYFGKQFKANYNFSKIEVLKPNENQKILEIENYLMKNLTNHFIGIEELAKQFYISPTKLKADFKSTFGVSIYQYYLAKQMILAHQLISEKNILVKDVAAMLCYDNVSKFIIAYKNHFGFSPSENL